MRNLRRCAVVALALFWCVHCSPSTSQKQDVSESTSSDVTASDISTIKNWAYQLQDIDVTAIGSSKFDLVVVDYSAEGDDATAFSAQDVATMKGAGETAKRVLAYMSIGEAENYRYYFNKNASYMEKANPDYPDNFKVYYWDAAWQGVIDSYLDRVVAAGFDGAYLDIIDAYEYFGPGGESGLNRASAAKDMVNFVRHIAQYARAKAPGFLIVPQNGSGILDDSGLEDSYLEVIDGIGAEDTFYYGAKDNNNLDRFVAKGKLVLVVDYLTTSAKIDDFYTRAEIKGYLPYATVRDLNVLTINKGHEP